MEMIPQKPGTFCWVELATNQTDSAKDFYQKLFNWSAQDMPLSETEFYTMFKLDDKDVAGGYRQGEMEKGIPPHWNAYIYVMNADETAANAVKLGAHIIAAPFDVMESGRMAILKDPDGAVFFIWQPKKHEGTRYKDRPGTFSWLELVAHNDEIEREFYSKLFGWTYKIETMGEQPYTVFMKDGEQVAGLMKMPKEWSSFPSAWGTYFTVADCDKSAELVKSLGGQVVHGPSDIPGIGRFAVVQDPQGAFFSILAFEKPA